MSCDEISADWAAQRIKGLDLGVAVMNALKKRAAADAQAEGRRAGRQDADRELPVPAQGPGHDVGSGRAQDSEARRQGPEGPRAAASFLRSRQKALEHRGFAAPMAAPRPTRRTTSSRPRRCANWSRRSRRRRSRGLHARELALSRLPHRRADGEEAGPLPRQLDLHPRSVGEGRPGAELPLLVARDGAARHELPRARIFLLRGRRPVERARRRADRARQERKSPRSA